MDERIKEILDFWFRGIDDSVLINTRDKPAKMWFIKDKNFDKKIKDQFETDIKKASQGDYENWEETPRGRLSLIILMDQFTRNIYRDTPQMFQTDNRALLLTQLSLKEKSEEQLDLIERVFVYMPLQHAEDIAIQKQSIDRFSSLVTLSKQKCPRNLSYYEYSCDYAKRHHDVIRKFGRFPHRNIILGRPSTPEELEFLKKPGSSF